jgi:hypothetical protein
MFENLVNLFNQQSTFIQVVVVAIAVYLIYIVYKTITKEKFAGNINAGNIYIYKNINDCSKDEKTDVRNAQIYSEKYKKPFYFGEYVCDRPQDESKCLYYNDPINIGKYVMTFKKWDNSNKTIKYENLEHGIASKINPKKLYILQENTKLPGIYCRKNW